MPFITLDKQPRFRGMADEHDPDRGLYGFIELNLDRVVHVRPWYTAALDADGAATATEAGTVITLDNGDEIQSGASHIEFVELVREAEARGT